MTVACMPEETFKQGCSLCVPETLGLSPTLTLQLACPRKPSNKGVCYVNTETLGSTATLHNKCSAADFTKTLGLILS